MRNLVEQSKCCSAHPNLFVTADLQGMQQAFDQNRQGSYSSNALTDSAMPMRMSGDQPAHTARKNPKSLPDPATAPASAAQADDAIFEGGPLYRLQALLALVSQDRPEFLRRALLVIAVCWVPLLILSAWHGGDTLHSFLRDYGAHGRFLIAAPLLILAEAACLPRLTALAINFLNAGFVAEKDYARFESIVVSTRKLLRAPWIEVVIILVSYAFVAFLIERRHQLPLPVPQWFFSSSSPTSAMSDISLTGWWGLLVSMPVIMALLLAWVWRLALWAQFLWRVSRMELHLLPAHPDSAAGIRFVGYSARAFTLLAFALGAFVAGTVANGISGGAAFSSYQYLIGSFVIGLLLVLNVPMCFFIGHLLNAWRRGTTQYGTLADKFGVEFERKWLQSPRALDQTVLEQPDFSAATDLYQVVDRVYAMQLLPVHPKSVLMLAIATLLPFFPIALMAVPLDVVVNKLAGLLL
jgi:hypothetical protein